VEASQPLICKIRITFSRARHAACRISPETTFPLVVVFPSKAVLSVQLRLSRQLQAAFFLSFSTIKFMFERFWGAATIPPIQNCSAVYVQSVPAPVTHQKTTG
jgi:hypothetical protein